MRGTRVLRGLAVAVLVFLPGQLHAYTSGNSFPFLPDEPASDFLPATENGPDHGFCSRWDPEYGHLGKACCSKTLKVAQRKLPRCAPYRAKWSFCDEMTEGQRDFVSAIDSGRARNWWEKRGASSSQAFCSVSAGFLVNGRPLVGTHDNRILIRNPMRCTNFGTDGLVAALEWLGREVAHEYSSPAKAGVHLNVADLSAPRGGCIWGRRGRGHASHTTGQDVDIGFLNTRVGSVAENAFTTHFDPEANWWLIKKLFSNPHVCVKSVFLDKRLIRKLARSALGDEYWSKVAHRIQHVKGHRSHLHIRVGHQPGEPGCPREHGWMNDGMIAPEDDYELGEDEPGQMVRERAPETSPNQWKVSGSSADALNVSSSAPARPASESRPNRVESRR